MSFRHLPVRLLLPVLCMLTVCAPTLATTQQQIDLGNALKELNKTEPFFADYVHVDSEFSKYCDYLSPQCIEYLHTQKAPIPDLPNNPILWDKFWAVIYSDPFAYSTEARIADFSSPNNNPTILLDIFDNWYLRQWSSAAPLPYKKVAALVENSLRQARQSGSLLDLTIWTAAIGISSVQLNLSLAVAAHHGDSEGFSVLHALTGPWSKKQLDIGATLKGELEFSRMVWENIEEKSGHWSYSEIFQHLHLLDISVMWNPQQAMMDRVFEEQAIMFAEFGKVSASKSEQFWELGWSSLNQHPMLQPNGSVIPLQPYKHYINTYRASAQQFILLRGLAQLYQDDAYGTIPTFPPPKHWKWVWEEELGPIETSAPALCLVPVSTHKSTEARNVCAVYWLAYNHLFPTPSNP